MMARSMSSILSLFIAFLLFAAPINSSVIGSRDSALDAPEALEARANCRTITVKQGDGCGPLAKRCGISAANFTKFNPKKNLCSTLVPGQKVCCSKGTLPTNKPQPGKDGSCAAYTVKSGDTCLGIGANRDITPANIESFNKKTWGWNGCAGMQIGDKICLSTGTAPMPATKTGYECGPQKPGTKKPAKGVDIATLNPCPNHACCSMTGQCGIDTAHCKPPPKNAIPGTKGCVSQCSTNIIKSPTPAKPFRSIGYFQGYNLFRPCVNMDVSQIDTSAYTHLHFAFGTLSSSFKVVIADDAYTQYEWAGFKALKGPKRILTIGGWEFSTNPSTYQIFRNGVKPANAATLAKNIANFVTANGLDGVDIDWEYPGTPDTPGIPAGASDEGTNFAAFLGTLKGLLGSKSLSVAIPATYYYSKAFPFKKIGQVVDYIVFMTYDLHGIGDTSSSDACPGGKCLQSPTNATEVNFAYSMMTKANVPSNKIVGGLTSYGRTYKMTSASCTAPTCTWNGNPAAGRCSGEVGFLSKAEIDEIIKTNPTAKKSYDAASNTDILIYNGTQWAGYMSPKSKTKQIARLQEVVFGGSIDWAIDFQAFLPSPAKPDSPKDEWESDWQDFKDAIAAGEDPMAKN